MVLDFRQSNLIWICFVLILRILAVSLSAPSYRQFSIIQMITISIFPERNIDLHLNMIVNHLHQSWSWDWIWFCGCPTTWFGCKWNAIYGLFLRFNSSGRAHAGKELYISNNPSTHSGIYCSNLIFLSFEISQCTHATPWNHRLEWFIIIITIRGIRGVRAEYRGTKFLLFTFFINTVRVIRCLPRMISPFFL